MPVLPLLEEAQYDTRRNAAKYNYDAQQVAGDYGRFVAQQRFDRSRQDLSDKFLKARNTFDNSYNRRGMFFSGNRQQGLRDFNTNRINQFNTLEQERANTLGQYNQTANLQNNAYQQALLDIDRERQGRIADLAEQLATLKGGY